MIPCRITCMHSTAIISVSYIDSLQRFRYAARSFRSLTRRMGASYPLHVVNDMPRNPRLRAAASRIYRGENVHLHERRGRGSAGALLTALDRASEAGAKLVFVHLDDHYYTAALGPLLRHANAAFAAVPALQIVRLGGGLLFGRATNPHLGNRTHLDVTDHVVRVGGEKLRPTRFDDFTLWSMRMHDAMWRSNLWPIALWLSVYRADYLRDVLTEAIAAGCRHLSHAEEHFREIQVWQRFNLAHAGHLGYINMQFAGIEMQRTLNWREIDHCPNVPIR